MFLRCTQQSLRFCILECLGPAHFMRAPLRSKRSTLSGPGIQREDADLSSRRDSCFLADSYWVHIVLAGRACLLWNFLGAATQGLPSRICRSSCRGSCMAGTLRKAEQC